MLGPEIKRLMDIGGLTVADVSHWLGVPRSTVSDWVNNDVKPMQFKRHDIWVKLCALNKLIAKRRGYVIPDYVSQRKRKDYINKLRGEV